MIKRAVIIDDDPISILVCETILKKYGFAEEILTFDSAQKGLTFLEDVYKNGDVVPEYIFLDVVMPMTDGWGFLEAYKNLGKESERPDHIVMLSATFDPDDKSRADGYSQVAAFLSKPITHEALDALRAKESVETNAE